MTKLVNALVFTISFCLFCLFAYAVWTVRYTMPMVGIVFVGVAVVTLGSFAVLSIAWGVFHVQEKRIKSRVIPVSEYGSYSLHTQPHVPLMPASVHVQAMTTRQLPPPDGAIQQITEVVSNDLPRLPSAPLFADIRRLVQPDRLILCYTASGPVYGTVDDLLSTNVNGKPGRGKTSLLYYIIAQLLLSQADITVFDPHGSMQELETMFTYLDNYEDMSNHVPAVEAMLQSRLARFKARQDVGKPHLFIIDEAPAIAAWEAKQRQAYKQHERETPHHSILQLAQTIILEARKLRVYVIIAGQSMPASVLPTIARDNLSSHYVFFSSDGHAKMAGLEKDDIDELLPLLKSAGPGMCVFDAPRRSDAEIGAIPQTTIDDLLELVPSGMTQESRFQMEELFPHNVKPFPEMETAGNDTETRLHVVESTVSDVPENTSQPAPKADILGVETGIRETVKRMKEKGMSDRDISQLVGLTGRKYPIYKQIIAELEEVTQEAMEA